MAGLQRSTTSFRRQGSSGLVWDDKLLSGELKKLENHDKIKNSKIEKDQVKDEDATTTTKKKMKDSSRTGVDGSFERNRSNGGGGNHRTGRVSPEVEPPSPKLSVCGFCAAFGKQKSDRRRPHKSGKH